MKQLKCDVLVIGSGAAGPVFAATLAERMSADVLLVEKGPHYTAKFFNQNELEMKALYAGHGARSTVDGAMPINGGECVGGGTTVNYALSFNPVAAVWRGWRSQYGLEGFSLDRGASDYGVPGLNLPRCVSDVRERCNVHTVEPDGVNTNNALFKRGCDRLGITTRPFDLNMRGCLRCGFCGQGCAYDRKRGTLVTFVPDALARGVRLLHHCSVDRLAFETSASGRRVIGAMATVTPTQPGSEPNMLEPGPVAIDASLVVLTAGSIESPVLLQRSGHPDPHDRIGRGLIAHPGLPIGGVFDEIVDGYKGITGSYYSDHFYRQHAFMFECLFAHPLDLAVAIPGFGIEHFRMMRHQANIAGFGVLLVDTPSDANRVRWNAETGEPEIFYQLSDADARRMRFAAARGVEVMLAAGAREAFVTSDEPLVNGAARFTDSAQAGACSSLQFLPHRTMMSSAHAQATLKMGAHPESSVVNSRGESHFVRNLMVCDSSAFPATCGVNPMISIMSLARYQAIRTAAEWPRYR
jgi:choline dehydrogenase-like flavoprotein